MKNEQTKIDRLEKILKEIIKELRDINKKYDDLKELGEQDVFGFITLAKTYNTVIELKAERALRNLLF
jgi:hypothetical protein